MRRGNLADFDPTKQLSGEFGVSIDNSTGNQKVFMAFGNGNVKELMTVEDAEAQIGELVDDAVDAAIGEVIDTATEAAETATTAAQTATTQAGTATTKAGEAALSASSASTDATSAAGSAASADDSAEDSEAWAVGQRDGQDVPATDETYHNNAKYWAEQASQAAGGGVTSFNGRSGSVSPQSGDYTAAMVGLGNVDNTSDLNKPISTATQTALNGKADTSSLTDGSVTKIGTGNVGSSTQPVYIDGGVPTAMTGALAAVNGGTGDIYGKAPFVYVGKVTDADIPVQGTAEVNRRLTVSLISGTASNHAPTANWYTLYTASGSDTGGDYGSQVAVGVNVDAAYFRTKQGGTWQPWHQIYGITTGTATSPNSNISLYRNQIFKGGNVIQVNIAANVTTAFTPSEMTKICVLPYKPKGNWVQIPRTSGLFDSTNYTGMAEIHEGTGELYWGSEPYTQLAVGQRIWINGTYLTED